MLRPSLFFLLLYYFFRPLFYSFSAQFYADYELMLNLAESVSAHCWTVIRSGWDFC